MPGALLEIAAKVVARLPNLGALIYEVAPGFVAEIGLDAIRAQLPRLNALWQLRPAVSVTVPAVDEPVSGPGDRPDPGDVLDWERVLGTLAIGHETKDAGGTDFGLGDDPGLEVLRTLIASSAPAASRVRYVSRRRRSLSNWARGPCAP